MAYTPTTWANGDTITAAKLNKLEQGVANSGSCLVVELTNSTGTADHTFAEIFEALRAGIPVYLHYPPTGGADWQEEYATHACVMPVLRAYKYDNILRVYASTLYYGTVGNITAAGLPCIYMMDAASLSSYPVFTKVVFVRDSYCSTDQYP